MSTWVDATRTGRCSNRCVLQIFFIPLNGENPETKANAFASPQSSRPLRCLSGRRTSLFKNTKKEIIFWVKWKYDQPSQKKQFLCTSNIAWTNFALSVRRMTEPESVFGQLKNNRGFRQFLLRGMEKMTLEVGWLSLAHNLLKQAANDQKRKTAILQ